MNKVMIYFDAVRCNLGCLFLLQIQNIAQSQLFREDLPVHEVSKCFNGPEKTITAYCSSNSMIHLYKVYYGYSNMEHCSPHKEDCKELDNIRLECQGQMKCYINLPTGNNGKLLPSCNFHSNYILMQYQCIPDIQVHNICNVKRITSQFGYIVTPNYPLNYPNSKNCSTEIVANKGQKLTIYAIDIDLETNNNNGCSDSLYILGTLKSKFLCDKRKDMEIFSTNYQHLHLQFKSDDTGQNKGFWLYFEVDPKIAVTHKKELSTAKPFLTTTRKINEKETTDQQEQMIIEKIKSTEEKNDRKTHNIPNNLYLVKIIGAILGFLLVILFTALITLFLKRKKENSLQESSSQSSQKQMYFSNNSLSYPFIRNNLSDSENTITSKS